MNDTIENVDITRRHAATSERSAIARLDTATENRLYALYRDYFHKAEETRNWNLWDIIPWDSVLTEPPTSLTDAVLTVYRDGVLLPDFSARALHILRSSRGRAWFLTRWSYEEVKCHLALREWLIRAGVDDNDLKTLSDEIMTAFRWQPPQDKPLTVMADALLWELRQIEQTRSLFQEAKAAGDGALTDVATRILTDHEMHRDFFRAALVIIAESYASDVQEAIRQVSADQEDENAGRTLLALLDMTAA